MSAANRVKGVRAACDSAGGREDVSDRKQPPVVGTGGWDEFWSATPDSLNVSCCSFGRYRW
jgi:hypothetical protein